MHPPSGRLRPIDLARAAGLSTQQVRNHADDLVLPPAPRGENGYRRFDERHRHALLTYRALVPGLGAPTARALMQALHRGRTDRALELLDAAHAQLHEQRTALRETARLLTGGAGRSPRTPDTDLRVGELAAHLGVRPSALRVWEAHGLLHPRRDPATGYRVFAPEDVRRARTVHLLRQVRHPLPRIRAALEEAGGRDPEAVREALHRRESELAARSRALLTGAGALAGYVEGLGGALDRTLGPA